MHGGVFHHVVGQVARGVLAAAVLNGVADQVQVLLEVDIEGRHSPGALGDLGLLFHIQHFHVLIHHNDTGALKLLNAGLLMAHDATGPFGPGKIHEFLKGELKDVVGRYHQEVIVNV